MTRYLSGASLPVLRDRLAELEIPFETEESEGGAGSELREQVEAIERWYLNDWVALDAKLRTSIVEGISVFLSLFDQSGVAGVFCPPPPEPDESTSIHIGDGAPGEDAAAVLPMSGPRRRLPPLTELIEGGRVVALNMPAGANPALGRAIGVLLKNAWMQALLRRPAEAARRPGRYLRPAVFICDEYQSDVLWIITPCGITVYGVACPPSITLEITLFAAGSGIPWSSSVRRLVVRPSCGTRPRPIATSGNSSSTAAASRGMRHASRSGRCSPCSSPRGSSAAGWSEGAGPPGPVDPPRAVGGRSPSVRMSEGWCELCDDRWQLTIAQHKGSTFVDVSCPDDAGPNP